MLRPILCIAILCSSSAVLAEPPPRVVERDGLKFEYSSVPIEDGKLLLEGRFLPSREEFRLVVSPNTKVSGWIGDRDVDFRISKTQRDRVFAGLARREDALASASAPRINGR